MPKRSCVEVERAVKGLRGSQGLHHIEAFGLIDRDDRTEDEIEKLAKSNVFALDVCSVEALYYCSAAITAVAQRQAESFGSNADEMIQSAKKQALDILNQNCLAENMAARRCERRARSRMLSNLPDWKAIKTNTTGKITICVDSPYADELNHFRQLVADGKLDELVARYPLRESPVFSTIAKALECGSHEKQRKYRQMVVSRIRKDGNLAQELKERILALSNALEDEPAVSENARS